MASMSLDPKGFVGDLSSRGHGARILQEVRSMMDARQLNSALFEKNMLFSVRYSLSAAEYDD